MSDLYISKTDFKQLIDVAYGAVSQGHPALECFKVVVQKDKITVTASDQANTVITSLPGKFEEAFHFLVPAGKLRDIVRLAPQGLLQLTLESTVVTIVADMTSWTIKVPTVEFPKIPKLVKPQVEMSADSFRSAIRATRKSIADSPLRPTLRMLSIRKGSMTACDGSRLSQASLGDSFPRDFSASIPHSSVNLVWELVKDDNITTVGLADSPNHCIYMAGNTCVLTKKLASSFPNVEQILLRPALENKQEFIVSHAEILKAVDRVRINADTKTDAIGLYLSSKSVTVTSRDNFGNTCSDTIPSTWTGKDRQLVINHKYLTSLVRAVESTECHFYLGDDTKSRKSLLLLKDEEKRIYAVIPQFAGNISVL
jgi:DNA polymerase III sliding clamp (beta) subunit (PCNA family)